MRFAQQVRPSTVPPQSKAVFDAPPAPEFSRTRSVRAFGGGVLKLVEGFPVPRDSRDGASKRSHSLAPAKIGPTRKKSAALCRQFSSTRQSRFSDCKFVHATTPADYYSPAALRESGISVAPAGGLRDGAAAQAGGSRALVLRPDDGHGGAGGGGGSDSG